jgi:hypothetical protein
MGLTGFVREAISCYLADKEAAWLGLEHACSEIDVRKCSMDRKADRNAEQKSAKSTAKEYRKRLLERKPRELRDGNRVENILHSVKNADTSHGFSYIDMQERMKKVNLTHVCDVLIWKINRERQEWIETFPNLSRAVSRGDLFDELGEEEILAAGDCSDWFQIEREYDLFLRERPDYEVYLLQKYLDWIDLSVGKIENDAPLKCRGLLPDHIKDFLFVANWCNLHGLDAACAVMSGAVLEQAIRAKYEERREELRKSGINVERIDSGATLGTVIEMAARADKDLPVLSSTAADKARRVMDIRNDAAHGNSRFFSRPEDVRIRVLALTTALLETLYYSEPEGSLCKDTGKTS